MEGRLASGDHKAVKHAPASLEIGEDLLLSVCLPEVCLVGSLDDELGIVAVGTAEIASTCEHSGCNITGKVDEVCLLEAAEDHALCPLAAAQLIIWLTPEITDVVSYGSGTSEGTLMTPYFCASSWFSMASTTL